MLYRFTLAKYRLWPGKGVFEAPLGCVFAGLLGMESGAAQPILRKQAFHTDGPVLPIPVCHLQPESGAMTFILWRRD
jgi:hypothetical protein